MTKTTSDTIFAIATGTARAAIAVMRLSGPHVRTVALTLIGRLPAARMATLARIRDPESGEILDEALVLFFEAARSELGEDGLELHLHGSRAVVGAVSEVLARMPGLRQAEPGEFARRAFANGKIDLTQLEGLADLIDAETAWQRRQAQRQLSGALRDASAPWRTALIAATADVETVIDFAEDIMRDDTLQEDVRARIDPIRHALRLEIAAAPCAERIREGLQVVIAGPPNAGKSTLLNALARRDAAIVSAVAGTTRDPIEIHLDLAGCPVTLVDTAGLRDAPDAVEQIGIARARARAEAADLVLWLDEGAAHPPAFAVPVWKLAAKADLGPVAPTADWFPISAQTGFNIASLMERLGAFAHDKAAGGHTALAVRQRHRQAFAAALAALDAIAAETMPVEILAEHLRVARFALDRLIGTVDVEDILDDLFARFCIGK